MEKYNGMIDYNGWIEIGLHIDCDDDNIDGSDLKKFFELVEPLVINFNSNRSRFMELKQINWLNMYHIGGAHNHDLGYLDYLLTLYKTIGEMAPGSFGLLYVRLPEHETYWNRYRVFRLAKGVLTEHEDSLLSPCSQ